jgi:hypothetical protein
MGAWGADRLGAHLLGHGRSRRSGLHAQQREHGDAWPGDFGNPVTCFMHAQAYLAGCSIGRELDANEWVNIVCMRSAVTASVRPR